MDVTQGSGEPYKIAYEIHGTGAQKMVFSRPFPRSSLVTQSSLVECLQNLIDRVNADSALLLSSRTLDHRPW